MAREAAPWPLPAVVTSTLVMTATFTRKAVTGSGKNTRVAATGVICHRPDQRQLHRMFKVPAVCRLVRKAPRKTVGEMTGTAASGRVTGRVEISGAARAVTIGRIAGASMIRNLASIRIRGLATAATTMPFRHGSPVAVVLEAVAAGVAAASVEAAVFVAETVKWPISKTDI